MITKGVMAHHNVKTLQDALSSALENMAADLDIESTGDC